ncbi:LD-carboxypeptidase [Haloimpatiens sp. FM7330]|uniref:S66 peptidase family protein n=1 Tax=Haloimpatiens sp. FM7330 TaxID=3298610 RepID=UPI00362BF30A
MIANKLKKGSSIGIITPSSPLDKKLIEGNINILKNLGFKVKLGTHIYENLGYLAGSDVDRANDLMNMFCDKTIDMILCARGGYGSMRILPLIDWSVIKYNPKIFVGFSDITCLLNEINKRCNLITFHGPMLTSNFEDKYTFKSLFNTLQSGLNEYTVGSLNLCLRDQKKMITEGYLVGGNLSLICSTLGTPYEIDTKNKILFIEDIDEPPYKIDRMLTQLLISNKLQQCRGFIIGHFTNCYSSSDSISISLEQVFRDRLLFLNKPTIMNFCCGHDYPNLTLPIGAKVKLDCINNKIVILDPVVK